MSLRLFNSFGTLASTVSDFTLTDIPDLQAWFNAQAITGLNDGQFVSSWTDDSGTGNTVSQVTFTKMPFYRTSGINGFPSLDFEGGDWMSKSSPIGLTNITGITIVFAVRPDNIAFRCICAIDDLVDGNSDNRAWNMRFTNSNTLSFIGSLNGSTLTIIQPSQGGLTIKPYLCMYSWDGATGASEIRTDGQINSSTQSTGTIFNSVQPLFVGSGDVDRDRFFGDIGEIAIWNRALNTSEKTQVINYFESQWGLTF